MSRIVKTKGVCGGSARIVDTRMPIWLIESWRRLWDKDEIFKEAFSTAYPFLTASDLNEAYKYARENKEEIEKEILENDSY